VTPTCKKPRPLERDLGALRDAHLFIIATEDTYAPAQYFGMFRNPKIQIRVLPAEGGKSAPEHVITRLDEFKNKFDTDDDDQLWLMLDTDHWTQPNHIQNFRTVCSEAVNKGYELAHSNPCFEFWLLLHLEEPEADRPFAACEDVLKRMRQILDGYNKQRLNLEHFPPESIQTAVDRAERLDRQPDGTPDDRWPQKPGSHVYRLVKHLFGDSGTASA
jgi:hypothetical protein